MIQTFDLSRPSPVALPIFFGLVIASSAAPVQAQNPPAQNPPAQAAAGTEAQRLADLDALDLARDDVDPPSQLDVPGFECRDPRLVAPVGPRRRGGP